MSDEKQKLQDEILFEMTKSIYFLYRCVDDLYNDQDGRLLNLRDSIGKTSELVEKWREL